MSNNNPNDIFTLPYAKWLEKAIQNLVKFPVKGIAINAITDNGEVYTNYHNISMADKLVISGIINQDATLDMMAANGIVQYADEEGGESDGTEEE